MAINLADRSEINVQALSREELIEVIGMLKETGLAAISELEEGLAASHELLGAYFDLHRHDSKVRELQHKTERLLWWDEIVK